jgi:hypothetical protein
MDVFAIACHAGAGCREEIRAGPAVVSPGANQAGRATGGLASERRDR